MTNWLQEWKKSEHAVKGVWELRGSIKMVADTCVSAFRNGNKIIWAGNGGSAAIAQHLSAELTGRFARESMPYASIALTCDGVALTAIANDYGYEEVFRRQLEALWKPGDVTILLTTSGRSYNIARATKFLAGHQHTFVWSAMRANSQVSEDPSPAPCELRFLGDGTAAIQEAHLVAGHLMVRAVEEMMMGDELDRIHEDAVAAADRTPGLPSSPPVGDSAKGTAK